MINDNIPAHLRTRKQLAEFAKRMAGTKPEAARLAQVIRGQLCAHRRALPTVQPVVARIIEQNMARLREMTA